MLDRVYFNTDLFSEESKETLTNISVLKYEIKKLAYSTFNIKANLTMLVGQKWILSKEIQKEYVRLSSNLSADELKEAWVNSKTKTKSRTKMALVKTLLNKAQTELKSINSEIKEKNRAIDTFKKQLPK